MDEATLMAAEKELNRRKCLTDGHRWDTVGMLGVEDPVGIYCTVCGRECRVVAAGASDG